MENDDERKHLTPNQQCIPKEENAEARPSGFSTFLTGRHLVNVPPPVRHPNSSLTMSNVAGNVSQSCADGVSPNYVHRALPISLQGFSQRVVHDAPISRAYGTAPNILYRAPLSNLQGAIPKVVPAAPLTSAHNTSSNFCGDPANFAHRAPPDVAYSLLPNASRHYLPNVRYQLPDDPNLHQSYPYHLQGISRHQLPVSSSGTPPYVVHRTPPSTAFVSSLQMERGATSSVVRTPSDMTTSAPVMTRNTHPHMVHETIPHTVHPYIVQDVISRTGDQHVAQVATSPMERPHIGQDSIQTRYQPVLKDGTNFTFIGSPSQESVHEYTPSYSIVDNTDPSTSVNSWAEVPSNVSSAAGPSRDISRAPAPNTVNQFVSSDSGHDSRSATTQAHPVIRPEPIYVRYPASTLFWDKYK